MSFSVVMPLRVTHPARFRSSKYVEDSLVRCLGDAEMILADDPEPDFNRGRALNAGVRAASGDVLVLADADIVVSSEALVAAIRAVEVGAALVVPFSLLVALNASATEAVLAGGSPWGPWQSTDVEYQWDRHSTGGLNVLRRSTFDAAGGFDPRFAGWGYEDAAFSSAVETLVGPIEWVDGTAVHLWHPGDETRRGRLPANGKALVGRYSSAWGDERAMRALIAER